MLYSELLDTSPQSNMSRKNFALREDILSILDAADPAKVIELQRHIPLLSSMNFLDMGGSKIVFRDSNSSQVTKVMTLKDFIVEKNEYDALNAFLATHGLSDILLTSHYLQLGNLGFVTQPYIDAKPVNIARISGVLQERVILFLKTCISFYHLTGKMVDILGGGSKNILNNLLLNTTTNSIHLIDAGFISEPYAKEACNVLVGHVSSLDTK